MPYTSKSKRRRKRLRRDRNRARRDVLLRSEPDKIRQRTSFDGKARSGDEAEIKIEFSPISVPFDPESESFPEETARRHAAVEAWDGAGNPTSGES